MPTLSQKLLTLAACALALAANWAAGSRFGMTPAVGPLLSPFEGFWQNAEAIEQPNVPSLLPGPGLKATVAIRFDSTLVPHIEAQNTRDLFYAQGYACAALRLWQMDFITRAAAGRISEFLGERALAYDRYQRRFGMGYAAHAALDSMMRDPATKQALEAYAAGANAYLARMDMRQIPLEFKIFGYRPEPWTPLKTAYLFKYMAYNLTGHTDEAGMSRALGLLGAQAVNALYPSNQRDGVPVIPAGTRYGISPLPKPLWDSSGSFILGRELLIQADRRNGSNNWALSGSRTASGKPLLANDPHLGLNLPALWVRMQLTCPGLDAAGLTLPGAPGIIIGHNRALAWGVTNTDADVLDLYKIRQDGPDHYLSGGKRLPFRKVVETIAVEGNDVVLDTVLYTHLGPMAYTLPSGHSDLPEGVAVGWLAHAPSNDLACFLGLNRARNRRQAEQALSHLACPAQNVVYADTAGNIGMYVSGRIYRKAQEQGKFVQDAGGNALQLPAYVPFEHNPRTINPGQGFVASANQHSTDSLYPYYINWAQGEPDRGNRIAGRLGKMRLATVDSMADIQLDNMSLVAQRFVPAMLEGLEGSRVSLPERDVMEMLRAWNLRYDSDQIAPSIFHGWFQALQDTVWDEMKGQHLPYPMHAQLANALSGGTLARYVDVKATPIREKPTDVYLASFHKAYQRLIKDRGAAGKAWNWGRVKHTQLAHLMKIPGLAAPFMSTPGGRGMVNAIDNDHGPSVRMIVDLKPPVRGFGNLPGGQSGNPGSPYYLKGLADWQMGKPEPWKDYRPGQKGYPGLMAIWQLRP